VKHFNVLIVDDNEADQKLLSVLFGRCPIPTRLHFATDGDAAIDFVFKRGEFAGVPTPDLILLDLNLPVKSGREVLQEIRQEQHLCPIPIVMMTTSTTTKEVNQSYCAGANAFVAKPVDLETFQASINTIATFWFQCVILPTHP